MNIRSSQFHLILIGQVGNFLHHFFYARFGYPVHGRHRFNLQVIFLYDEAAIIEIGGLL